MNQKTEDVTADKFLDLLAKDIGDHPERCIPIPLELLRRVEALVSGVDVGDINEKLPEDDE